jgi:hypothetical protein
LEFFVLLNVAPSGQVIAYDRQNLAVYAAFVHGGDKPGQWSAGVLLSAAV